MKVNKFSEKTESELIERINDKMYIVMAFDKNKKQVLEAPSHNINKAIEMYYSYKQNNNPNNDRYIFLVEKEMKVLTEEEIEILNTTNKYNL